MFIYVLFFFQRSRSFWSSRTTATTRIKSKLVYHSASLIITITPSQLSHTSSCPWFSSAQPKNSFFCRPSILFQKPQENLFSFDALFVAFRWAISVFFFSLFLTLSFIFLFSIFSRHVHPATPVRRPLLCKTAILFFSKPLKKRSPFWRSLITFQTLFQTLQLSYSSQPPLVPSSFFVGRLYFLFSSLLSLFLSLSLFNLFRDLLSPPLSLTL